MGGILNLNYILYIAFRLSPFIIVSFFSLSSILNQDLKGLIYLAGMLFACFFAVAVGSSEYLQYEFKSDDIKAVQNAKIICNTLSLSDTGRISNLPLSMVVFSYTFFYLVEIIAKYNLASQNIPTLVIFPLLIIGDFIWNTTNGCNNGFPQMIVAFGIGACWGALWSYIIRSTGIIQLQYFNGISNSQSCSRPSKQMFRCTSSTTK